MRCIFCKNPSNESKSVEHIVPESLGNEDHILPRGVVCDRCNNYFATKVEEPVLSSPRYRILRGWQAVANKRGRFHPVRGFTWPGAVPIELERYPRSGEPSLAVEISETLGDCWRSRSAVDSDRVAYFPVDGTPPESGVMSRFLAKMAVEALAHRVLAADADLATIVDDEALDPLRTYARRGSPVLWSFHERRIYDAEAVVDGLQTLHEFDLFETDIDELHFVIAIFGIEYCLNVVEPDLAPYDRWLRTHGRVSPLYFGKNAK